MKYLLYHPETDFLQPYFTAHKPKDYFEGIDGDGFDSAGFGLMISSTDIYGAGEKENVTEDSSVDESSRWFEYEKHFLDFCTDRGLRPVILRCAPIVGTGMGGFTGALARDVYRGIFFHFPDNEARVSVVHAVDVASVGIRILEGMVSSPAPVYILADCDDPKLDDLAEALAYRMNEKRISNLSTRPQQVIARWLYGKRYTTYTSTRTFVSLKAVRELDFEPVTVVNYLRTHVYDENSL